MFGFVFVGERVASTSGVDTLCTGAEKDAYIGLLALCSLPLPLRSLSQLTQGPSSRYSVGYCASFGPLRLKDRQNSWSLGPTILEDTGSITPEDALNVA